MKVRIRAHLHKLWKDSSMPAPPWKSGASAPRKGLESFGLQPWWSRFAPREAFFRSSSGVPMETSDSIVPSGAARPLLSSLRDP